MHTEYNLYCRIDISCLLNFPDDKRQESILWCWRPRIWWLDPTEQTVIGRIKTIAGDDCNPDIVPPPVPPQHRPAQPTTTTTTTEAPTPKSRAQKSESKPSARAPVSDDPIFLTQPIEPTVIERKIAELKGQVGFEIVKMNFQKDKGSNRHQLILILVLQLQRKQAWIQNNLYDLPVWKNY